jgi:hypothetical protein
MADYLYADDGKIHTRYSELLRCTTGQIDKVVWERTHPDARAQTESMGFGIVRHQMFDEESKKTGRLPACFGLDMVVNHVEAEFATEIMKGVVVHSRMDSVSVEGETIIDYKTVLDGKHGWQKNLQGYGWRPIYDYAGNLQASRVVQSSKQKQLKFYAFQLGLHGIRIKRGMFLCEIWNQERDEILDYRVVEFPITLADIAPVLPWVKDRVALLSVVLAEQEIRI